MARRPKFCIHPDHDGGRAAADRHIEILDPYGAVIETAFCAHCAERYVAVAIRTGYVVTIWHANTKRPSREG